MSQIWKIPRNFINERSILCVSFEQKRNGLLQRRSKDSVTQSYFCQRLFIQHAHKVLLKQAKYFPKRYPPFNA